ncbi:MAG: Rieske 2Fe-2S domain-containing protein [Myxococcales bacterium]|nr:Rieske 2Fe-2S domain-containing protein [Myxococcales bacterium]
MSVQARATEAVTLCALTAIPADQGRAFRVGNKEIAVFRTRAGGVHAVANRCPHRGAPLADGIVAGGRVQCPYHGDDFDLATGEPVGRAYRCAKVFAAEVDGDQVTVWI